MIKEFKKLILASFMATAIFAGQTAMAKTDNIYKEGKVKIVKAEIPKSGFIGSPIPQGFPSMYRPTRPEDFYIRYVRATVLVDRSIEGGKRKVIRVDEVTSGAKLIASGIYYIYIDLQKEGDRIVYHEKDNNSDVLDSVVTYGIWCPFICARPPAMNAAGVKRAGYVDYRVGWGIDYKMKDTKETSGGLQVEATWFDTSGPDPIGKRTPKWYQSNIEDVYKNPKTRVMFREKQVWSRPDDWLWREMERYDENGNILIRCKEVN